MYQNVFEIFETLKRLHEEMMTTNTFNRNTISAWPQTNDESYEFLSNAIVATVDEVSRCKQMKDLPTPKLDMKEVR
jgi:hypothetical protein